MGTPARTDGDAGQSRRHVRLVSGLGLAAAILVADQLSKWLIVAVVMDPPRVVPILPGFNLVLVHNTGVSFGLFGDAGAAILIAGAIAICLGLAFWLRRAENLLLALAIGGIIGGATGNVIDRIRLGAVIDFLDVHVPGSTLPHWPAFNVADSAIVVGVCAIVLDGFLAGRGTATGK